MIHGAVIVDLRMGVHALADLPQGREGRHPEGDLVDAARHLRRTPGDENQLGDLIGVAGKVDDVRRRDLANARPAPAPGHQIAQLGYVERGERVEIDRQHADAEHRDERKRLAAGPEIVAENRAGVGRRRVDRGCRLGLQLAACGERGLGLRAPLVAVAEPGEPGATASRRRADRFVVGFEVERPGLRLRHEPAGVDIDGDGKARRVGEMERPGHTAIDRGEAGHLGLLRQQRGDASQLAQIRRPEAQIGHGRRLRRIASAHGDELVMLERAAGHEADTRLAQRPVVADAEAEHAGPEIDGPVVVTGVVAEMAEHERRHGCVPKCHDLTISPRPGFRGASQISIAGRMPPFPGTGKRRGC